MKNFWKAPPSYYPSPHNLVCVGTLVKRPVGQFSPPSHLAPPWTPRSGVTAEGGESSCGSREGSWSHQISPNGISVVMITCYQISRLKKQPRQHTSWSMIDILLNVMFFEFSHKSQSCWVFGGFKKCRPFDLPKNLGQNVATQSWPIKSCLQSCSKVSGADFESSPGSKD